MRPLFGLGSIPLKFQSIQRVNQIQNVPQWKALKRIGISVHFLNWLEFKWNWPQPCCIFNVSRLVVLCVNILRTYEFPKTKPGTEPPSVQACWVPSLPSRFQRLPEELFATEKSTLMLCCVRLNLLASRQIYLQMICSHPLFPIIAFSFWLWVTCLFDTDALLQTFVLIILEFFFFS